MKTLTKCLIASAIMMFIPASAATAAPQSLQGWQGPAVHAHGDWPLPMFATISGCVPLTYTTLFHNNSKAAQWVRWSDGSSVKQSVSQGGWKPGALPAVTRTDTLNVCQSQFDHWGWREVRVSQDNESPRDFGTSRWCVWVPDNGKGRSDYCGGPTVAGRCGGGWWYADITYSIVFVDCRDVNTVQSRALVAGDKIRAHAQLGTLIARIDPDFHNGYDGIAAPVVSGAITIPSGLAPGLHKLHMRDQNANGEAGVYVLQFTI